ncbi:hypothetical protein RclHR1_07080002 [Rhizophagus clarus]|uniref:FAD-binding PCMH-type domain-containing protein n=1 Tax=Rhizophagus clarus TaxID=94130 RepID=A0A2Z6S7G5_9GLOM|nr:hypothetical protein RclHR1_07080002 [Rhizophagus clarus]
MKLMKQLDVVSLLLWCILSFNFVNSKPVFPFSLYFESIEGPIIYQNDTRFETLIIDQNIRVNYTPSVIVYAVNNNDVQKAVKSAIKLGKDIVPRSGGHSYEKYGLGGRNDTIVLDTTFINGVTVDSKQKTARIGAGNRLGDVYNKLSQEGFFFPAGSCPSVGIGGHALGGGFGYFSRKYGLACDNVISMEMVDAKGSILQVNKKSNPDLFFALRGAGAGSYGIVTHYTVRLHRTPPRVTYMQFDFNRTDIKQLQQLFSALNKVGPSLDNNISLKLRLGSTLSITGVYLGPRKKAKIAMREFLYEAPDPISLIFEQKTFFESVELLSRLNKYDVVNPKHNPNFFKIKSFVVKQDKGLTQEAIQYLVNYLDKMNGTRCNSYASFDLYGGTVNVYNDVNPTSFIHRNALYTIQVEAGWKWEDNEEHGKNCTDAVNKFGREFQSKYTSYFSHQGFIDRDLDDWETRYYGDIFEDLKKIKSKYDPNNLFNFPQSIPPSNKTNNFSQKEVGKQIRRELKN